MSDRAVFFDFIQTPYGEFQVAATERGVTGIYFPGRSAQVNSKKIPPRVRNLLNRGKKFLRDFFSGNVRPPEKIRVDWSFVSVWDQRVLKTLGRLPPGKTMSYQGLAKLCLRPRAARAVGNALHRNPIPILLPCHRVIRKDETLGGYGGGIRWKRLLLRLEQGSEPPR